MLCIPTIGKSRYLSDSTAESSVSEDNEVELTYELAEDTSCFDGRYRAACIKYCCNASKHLPQR